jgi:Ca2+-binding EF-hand superfamily protein
MLRSTDLQVIAYRSSTDDILELRKAFDQYDSANDGIITYEEFKQALRQANYSEDAFKEIFDSVVSCNGPIDISLCNGCDTFANSWWTHSFCQDVNKNGHIMFTEFIAATLEVHGRIEEERIAEAFDRLDSDDSGYISKANLREFLGKNATAKQINEIIKEGDKDKDGKRKLGCASFDNSCYCTCIRLNVKSSPFRQSRTKTSYSYSETKRTKWSMRSWIWIRQGRVNRTVLVIWSDSMPRSRVGCLTRPSVIA